VQEGVTTQYWSVDLLFREPCSNLHAETFENSKSNVMKAILLFGICVVLCTSLNAQYQGPRRGNDFNTSAITGSVSTWINLSNSSLSDDAYASFGDIGGGAGSYSIGSYTDYLVVTDFGFNVPSGAVVTGILVEVEGSDPNERTSDYSVRLIRSGVIEQSEKATHTAFTISDSYRAYGGSSDMWGATWDDRDLNDARFGFAIAAQRNAGDGVTLGQVDDIRITVYYLTILPVKLLSFSAVKGTKTVQLNWTTAEESSMNRYEVERSINGSSFSSINSVPSRNNSMTSVYSLNDNHPFVGASWYRLKMVNNSGEVKYSMTISVHFTGEASINLYPNPLAKGQLLYITNPDKEELKVQFYSMSGKLLSTAKTTTTEVPVMRATRPQEVVMFRISDKNDLTVGTGRLVLE
jgi:hypothetical protein